MVKYDITEKSEVERLQNVLSLLENVDYILSSDVMISTTVPVTDILIATASIISKIAAVVENEVFTVRREENPFVRFSKYSTDELGNPKQIQWKRGRKTSQPDELLAQVLYKLSETIVQITHQKSAEIVEVALLEERLEEAKQRFSRPWAQRQQDLLLNRIHSLEDWKSVLQDDLSVLKSDSRKLGNQIFQERKKVYAKKRELSRLQQEHARITRQRNKSLVGLKRRKR